MAQLTAAQAQTICDQCLQQGDAWNGNLLGYFSPQVSGTQINNILAPIAPYLTGHQLCAVVRAVATVKGWVSATTDAVKLSQLAAAVSTLLNFNATTAATASVSPDTRVSTIAQHIGMGGQLVAALATLT
jgi:hypothetical protein